MVPRSRFWQTSANDREDANMFTISKSVCTDAPASRVWKMLSELESIHLWVESIKRSYCVGESTRGIDTVRICELGDDVTIKETIVAWVEGESFTSSAKAPP